MGKLIKKTGKELIFINRIDSDGKGQKRVIKKDVELLKDEKFTINCLSITEGTFIASGMNTFVVKFKPIPEEKTTLEDILQKVEALDLNKIIPYDIEAIILELIKLAKKLDLDKNYGSTEIILGVKTRYDEVFSEDKRWDVWRAFYNGWIEGRINMLKQIKEIRNGK